jgi:hypothetical protein
MKVKEMFEEIKDIFKSEGVQVETPSVAVDIKPVEKFEDLVLADGTVAQVEPEVIVGAAVVLVQDEELVPAPDGSWELADGRIITTEGGVITEIEEIEDEPEEIAEAEEEVEEVEELDKSPLNEEQKKEAKKIIESIITEKVFSKEDTNISNEEFSARINKLEKSFESLLKLVEFLVKEPTKTKVNKAKNGFAKLQPKKKTDIIEKLKNINKLKK